MARIGTGTGGVGHFSAIHPAQLSHSVVFSDARLEEVCMGDVLRQFLTRTAFLRGPQRPLLARCTSFLITQPWRRGGGEPSPFIFVSVSIRFSILPWLPVHPFRGWLLINCSGPNRGRDSLRSPASRGKISTKEVSLVMGSSRKFNPLRPGQRRADDRSRDS